MLSLIWMLALAVLAAVFSAASLCLWLRERGIRPIRGVAAFLSRHTTPERILLGAFFVVMWMFASTKPGGGSRGAPARPADEWEGFVPITSTNTTRTLDGDDFRRGFVLTRVGTNETHTFAASSNAVACADWLRFGAAEDWVYESGGMVEEWKSGMVEEWNGGEVDWTGLRIHSDGWGEVLGGSVFCPFRAALGIAPEANWPMLGESAAPCLFWHAVTPSGSLVLTWRNALFGRDTNTPVSVQMEAWPGGRFVYRYDLRSLECRIENEELDLGSLTNVTIGARLGSVPFKMTLAEMATNATFSIFNSPFSISFHTLLPEDAANPDRDGDGLATIDELFVHHTDPSRADSDDDGLSDPEELAASTDPWNPDTDGDGLLDGEEAALGTDPFSCDSDSDGVGDFAEVCVRGTDPLLADSDGDGIADAVETEGSTDPLAADTDGDGLGDAAELQHGTNPRSPDSDGDGAPDGWEVSAGSNPLLADTDGDGLSDGIEMKIGSSPLLADTDGDGVSDFAEFTTTRTSPVLADTDGDGLSDAAELAGTTNPLKADSDGDGLSDGAELAAGTDPLDPDTDGDGLEDGAEAAAGASPLNSDTDGDGMPDAWEARYGLNPGYRQDANGDADFDGLTNLQEFQIGSSPILADTDGDGRSDYSEHGYGTSPVLADTDGDGLDDGDEHRRGTSGADADTDDDGLPDGWEVAHSLNPNAVSGIHGASGDPDGDGVPNLAELALGTDPRVADTDGDGMDDGDEVGGFRWRYVEGAEWASETNGWTAVDVDLDDMWGCFWLYPEEILYVGDEEIYDIACQWNGVLLVSTEGHYADYALASPPAALSGQYVSDAALTVAPCWVEASTNAPAVCAFRRADGGCVRYAVRYDGLAVGTNEVSVQVVLSFTNGVYSSAEVSYGSGATAAVDGVDASVGLQDAVNGRRWSAGFGDDIYIYPLETLQFVQGSGTDPLGAVEDTDGDGLPDKFEEEIGTDPRQPDTDGDGMHDGWERAHGFDPLVDNGADGSPGNDADADPDEDGLTNGEEADWGTDPNHGDTDRDGVPDGEEAANFSDPADASDGGRPASRVPVAFVFGDPSGSHSEKYRLVVKPKKDPDGQSPAAGAAPRAFEWVNAQYGECETKTAMLRRGWTYEVRMFHAGTRPGFDGGPDYDYSLSCVVPPGAGVVTNDPQRLFGGNGNSGEVFEADGKAADILVLDGCIVGDCDRSGGFDAQDLLRAYRGLPMRHWVNDDDDEGDLGEGDGDVPGLRDPAAAGAAELAEGCGREPDCANGRVDGRCDVLDFAPAWIDMGLALRQLTNMFDGTSPDDYALTLSQPEGAVSVVWTSLSTNNAAGFLTTDVGNCGLGLSQALREADSVRLTEDETRVPDALVAAMLRDRANGVFLFEGRTLADESYQGTKRIRLRCYRRPCAPGDGSHLFEIALPISVTPVEDMFRWVDERWVCGTNGMPSRTASPANNPDSECDGRHFVFVHGYSVNTNAARGWASEMFKRLWQSGSQSMFTAVDWFGDDSRGSVSFPPGRAEDAPDYYANVEHAFATAARFAADCAALPGRKVVLAHSLGNMLVSSAIKDHGLADYAKYYMLNAAVPMEAYDHNAFTNAMIDFDWRSVTNVVYSANWHRLFDMADGRKDLTWNGKFVGISNAVNCFSTSEDTLGNAEMNEWLVGKRKRKKFWAIQEVLKGTEYLNVVPDSWGLNCEGGWGYNPHYATNWWYVTWPNRRMTERFKNRIGRLTRDELIRHPVFKPFDEGWLFTTNAISYAAVTSIRARILADGIPALSFAAGANRFEDDIVKGSIDYATCKSGEWPRRDGQWLHSDIKNIAFRFNHLFFKKIVKEEEK